jgi:hypothetical protein
MISNSTKTVTIILIFSLSLSSCMTAVPVPPPYDEDGRLNKGNQIIITKENGETWEITVVSTDSEKIIGKEADVTWEGIRLIEVMKFSYMKGLLGYFIFSMIFGMGFSDR